MEWVSNPVLQLGAFGVLLLVIGMVFTGRLIPKGLVARSTLDDVRADRDVRVAEANDDAEKWRQLFEREREAHQMTRQAHAEEIRATLLASTESSQIAAAALTELKRLQIEGSRHDS